MMFFSPRFIKNSLMVLVSLFLYSAIIFSQEAEISYPKGMYIDNTCEVQTSPSSDLQIPKDVLKREPDFIDKTLSNIAEFSSGCGNAVYDMMSEPILQAYDNIKALNYYFSDNKEAAMVWEPKSASWKAWKAGMSPSDQLHAMGKGIINLPWEFFDAVNTGDAKKAGYTLTNIAAIALPVGKGLSTITFPERTLGLMPVTQADGSLAMAAVTIRTISIEGVTIQKGCIAAMMASGENGFRSSSHYDESIEEGIQIEDDTTLDDLQEEMTPFDVEESSGSRTTEIAKSVNRSLEETATTILDKTVRNFEVEVQGGRTLKLHPMEEVRTGAIEITDRIANKNAFVKGAIIDAETGNAVGTFNLIIKEIPVKPTSRMLRFNISLDIESVVSNEAPMFEGILNEFRQALDSSVPGRKIFNPGEHVPTLK